MDMLIQQDRDKAPDGREAPQPDPQGLGSDERRMQVRAYNYWVSLLDDRPFPSIQDVNTQPFADFATHGVLLDLSRRPEDPELVFIGAAVREACELSGQVRRISQVPPGSLLSRLTDHYLQIVATRAPVGFEAEFVSRQGYCALYRGILMPLASEGVTVDAIYGVINWKQLADAGILEAEAAEPRTGDAASEDDASGPLAADPETAAAAATRGDGGLGDRLAAARYSAEEARQGEQRSRAALYRALGQAHDFALAAEADRDGYAELLADAGLKVQARAPMTPVVKLVFGSGYDKTRLTEFAAALGWAQRKGVGQGGLAAELAAHPGGLKGVVQAERRARRPQPDAQRAEALRERLRTAPAFAEIDFETDGEEEFVLLVARRAPGGLAIVAPVADPKLIDLAIRRSGRFLDSPRR
jgi:hypothetical protein